MARNCALIRRLTLAGNNFKFEIFGLEILPQPAKMAAWNS